VVGASSAAAAQPAERLRALDVFRGATVALMILVNNPGSWSHLYPPLAHAAWHGLTPTDLVFPFFLFAVGNALALVLPRLLAAGHAVFWRRVLLRTLAIFAIGLLLNWSPFVRWAADGTLVPKSLDTLRVMGVLQRIALAFGAAAAIAWLLRRHLQRGLPLAAAALLLLYWALCETLGRPGDVYSLEGFFGTPLDRALLGAAHLYKGEGVPFDPEGLASTLPAVAQVLLGAWAGQWMLGADGRLRRPDAALVVRLCTWAVVLGGIGLLWQLQMPLNKKLWTSSYVCVTTALALAALALCLHALDLRAPTAPGQRVVRGVARFFEVFGRNPLFIFVLSGLVPRVLGLLRWPADGAVAAGAAGTAAQGATQWTPSLPSLASSVMAPLGRLLSGDPRLGSLLYALANVAAYAAIAWWMDRRGIVVRV
jgi:predicted acyltransferase